MLDEINCLLIPSSLNEMFEFRMKRSREVMPTLVTSSLSLMHGWVLTDDSLMTILRGLLFSPFENERKSFVRKVPIPNVTESQWLLHPKNKDNESPPLENPSLSHCLLIARHLSIVKASEYTRVLDSWSIPIDSYIALTRGPKRKGSPESWRRPVHRWARSGSATNSYEYP